MTQPPHGEDPQDPRAPGWGRPGQQFDGRQPDDQDTGWGPPSGTPYQGGQYGGGYGAPGQPAQPGQYGGPYGQPYGAAPPSGQPGQYGAQPGQYGAQPGQYGYEQQQYGQYGGQPGYGQYGQYGGWEQPPPPPRKRRFGVLFMLLVLALLVGLAFTLPARLSSTRLDPDAVQRDVAAQYEQREGVPIEVRCDQRMTVETGKSYECDGTTADEDTVTITIAITSEDGDYTWSDS